MFLGSMNRKHLGERKMDALKHELFAVFDGPVTDCKWFWE